MRLAILAIVALVMVWARRGGRRVEVAPEPDLFVPMAAWLPDPARRN